eukprot:COSAG03_NODE_496_length_7430_cov_3.744237_5_plen_328_part_00
MLIATVLCPAAAHPSLRQGHVLKMIQGQNVLGLSVDAIAEKLHEAGRPVSITVGQPPEHSEQTVARDMLDLDSLLSSDESDVEDMNMASAAALAALPYSRQDQEPFARQMLPSRMQQPREHHQAAGAQRNWQQPMADGRALGPVASAHQISMKCIDWEDSANVKPPVEGARHARYVLEVNAGDQQHPFHLRKRWQEVSDFAKNLRNYNQILRKPYRWGDKGELGLPTKYFRADLQQEAQMARIQEINEFLTHLTKWLTRVANEPEQKLNLLLERTYGNGPDAELDLNVVARFFKRGAGYDALASTLTAEQFAVLANQTGSTPTDSRR